MRSLHGGSRNFSVKLSVPPFKRNLIEPRSEDWSYSSRFASDGPRRDELLVLARTGSTEDSTFLSHDFL